MLFGHLEKGSDGSEGQDSREQVTLHSRRGKGEGYTSEEAVQQKGRYCSSGEQRMNFVCTDSWRV